jgi:hypothetical protein
MASFNNLDDLLNHFVEMDCPYYIVSEDKKSIFSMNNKVANIDEASEKLQKVLEHKDHSKIYHIYCFKSLTKAGLQIPTKAGNHLLFSYQKAKPEYTGEQKAMYYGGIGEIIRNQNEKIDRLQTLLESKLIQDEEIEDDDNLKDQMQNNIIGQIMGNPAIANIITNLLTNIFANNITNGNMQQPMQNNNMRPQALAGDDVSVQELELAQTLEILFDKGITIEHLKKLASYPTAKIKMLLTML